MFFFLNKKFSSFLWFSSMKFTAVKRNHCEKLLHTAQANCFWLQATSCYYRPFLMCRGSVLCSSLQSGAGLFLWGSLRSSIFCLPSDAFPSAFLKKSWLEILSGQHCQYLWMIRGEICLHTWLANQHQSTISVQAFPPEFSKVLWIVTCCYFSRRMQHFFAPACKFF